MTPDAFARKWTSRRDEFRTLGVQVDGARICDDVLSDFADVVRNESDVVLSLKQAAAHSGYSKGHLGRLVRQGIIPNAGKPQAPRIRTADLPARPRAVVAERRPKAYDVATDARSLVNRRKGGAYGSSQHPS